MSSKKNVQKSKLGIEKKLKQAVQNYQIDYF